MKKILIFIYILVILVFLKLIVTFSINEVIIYRYEKGNYDRNFAKSLFVLNFNEKYIAHYNYGNILYKIGYYEDAIKEYNKALDNKPKEDRVCSIRINLALAMINTINDEMECEDKYKVYENSLEVLYEDGCAFEGNDNGSSEIADKLEEEIQTLYTEEKATCESEQQEDEGDDGEEEDDSEGGEGEEEEKSEDEKKADELDERNKDAQGSRQEELDKYEDYDGYGYGYDYYDGKKW